MSLAASAERRALAGVLAATLSVQALATWAVLALAAVAPLVAQSVDLPPVLIGYQISLAYAMAALVSLFGGSLVARAGAARVSQISMLACAAGCALATIPGIGAIAVATLAIGFGYGLTNPSSAHLLARHTTARNRGLVFSIKQTGVPIGGVAAGIATPAVAIVLGWQAAILAIVPIALLVALALAPRRAAWDADRDPDAPVGIGAMRGATHILAVPALRWLCLAGFFYAAIQLCLLTFVVTFAVVELGFDPLAAGGLLAVVQAGGATGRLFWGALADRVQRNGLVLAGIGALSLACALAMAGMGPQTSPVVLYALAGAFGATAVGWNGVFLSEAVRLAPGGAAGTTAGIATFSTFAGVLVGPAAFVQIQTGLDSFTAAYALLAVPAALGAAAAIMAAARGKASPR